MIHRFELIEITFGEACWWNLYTTDATVGSPAWAAALRRSWRNHELHSTRLSSACSRTKGKHLPQHQRQASISTQALSSRPQPCSQRPQLKPPSRYKISNPPGTTRKQHTNMISVSDHLRPALSVAGSAGREVGGLHASLPRPYCGSTVHPGGGELWWIRPHSGGVRACWHGSNICICSFLSLDWCSRRAHVYAARFQTRVDLQLSDVVSVSHVHDGILQFPFGRGHLQQLVQDVQPMEWKDHATESCGHSHEGRGAVTGHLR